MGHNINICQQDNVKQPQWVAGKDEGTRATGINVIQIHKHDVEQPKQVAGKCGITVVIKSGTVTK